MSPCTHRVRESPKLSQANGTPSIILAPQSHDGSPDPAHSKSAGEGAYRMGLWGRNEDTAGWGGLLQGQQLSQGWMPHRALAGMCLLGSVSPGVEGSQQELVTSSL